MPKREGVEMIDADTREPIERKHRLTPTEISPNRKRVSRVTVSTLAKMYDRAPLTMRDIAKLRGFIRDEVQCILPLAIRAVEGDIKWTPQQVSLFRTLMAKVVPDLSQSHTTVEHRHVDVNRLSRDELEEIASGLRDGEVEESPSKGVLTDEESST
jgi:hypothetical protein